MMEIADRFLEFLTRLPEPLNLIAFAALFLAPFLIIFLIVMYVFTHLPVRKMPVSELGDPPVAVVFHGVSGGVGREKMGIETGCMAASKTRKRFYSIVFGTCLAIWWFAIPGSVTKYILLTVVTGVFALIVFILLRHQIIFYENGLRYRKAFTSSKLFFSEIHRITPVIVNQNVYSHIDVLHGGTPSISGTSRVMTGYLVELKNGRSFKMNTSGLNGVQHMAKYLRVDTNPQVKEYQFRTVSR